MDLCTKKLGLVFSARRIFDADGRVRSPLPAPRTPAHTGRRRLCAHRASRNPPWAGGLAPQEVQRLDDVQDNALLFASCGERFKQRVRRPGLAREL